MHLHPFVRVNALPALLCVRLTLQRTKTPNFVMASLKSAVFQVYYLLAINGNEEHDVFQAQDRQFSLGMAVICVLPKVGVV